MWNSKNFGESVAGYEMRVLNEREARAGAGILFAFAMLSFMKSFLTHDFAFTKIFVTFFMVDFLIRIFVNPKYAPSLIMGRFFVSNQRPEYVGAAQKRFAWSIGLTLAIVMFLLIVVFEVMTPIKIIICIVCLVLLFSESAFGICLGCKLYPIFNKNALQCAGDSCELKAKEPIQEISTTQYAIAILAIIIFGTLTYLAFQPKSNLTTPQSTPQKCASGKCAPGKCGGGM